MIELSVDDFIQILENLTRKTFTSYKILIISVFLKFLKIIISYFADDLYLSKNLETELKEIFDEKMFMFHCFYTTVIEIKIVLSIIIIQKCSSCFFTNYHKLNKKFENCDKSEAFFSYS